MYSKNWLVIRDDVKKTFEVYGKEANTDWFTNKVIAMQRAGMNVTAVTPPVTNKAASKTQIKFTGYTEEPGLYDRLDKQLQSLTRHDFGDVDLDID